ncbi:hypothetical protein KV557_33550 [Kitasatospora aureofaciens]|uniref:hypothetical protein n=1 Tax=Kitasatospora aureofaciens TaxID=1894 RepID=UPI001C46B362|nr:hypothetical protein [Kitasatospora aureofaciens]MBV6701976.1 hypothetical protein [Kitasatospora aureofaciens]
MRVRLPDRRHPGWWHRRLPATALVWSVVVAIGVAPIGLGTAPQAVAATDSAVTAKGPKVWIPKDKKYGPEGKVTVAQTKNLVDQVVHVSWSGFTPSTDAMGGLWNNGPQRAVRQPYYQVRVYQCRGTDPKITDCYDSTLFNADPTAGFQQKTPPAGTTFPDFPSNMAIAVTDGNGSGFADIEVYTADQSPSLGCDDKHPCSLVVEPNYGGDTASFTDTTRKGVVNCDDHSLDQALDMASDQVLQGYTNKWTKFKTSEQCSWERRAVVPLEFAPTPAACSDRRAAFTAAGLEPAKRAMQQWQAGLCQGSDPISLQYGFANGDSQSRADFLAGRKDMALTARPDTQVPPRPYVYAPLATSGISVVFLVDDPKSSRQIRDMRLNARLMAKLLTQSYAPQGSAQVASVAGNPGCIFDDPEFVKLNPVPSESKLTWPTLCAYFNFSPTVLGTTADMTYQLTSWIASDPDAVRFLDGEPDPWGMHVDTFYLRPAFSGYPVDAFSRQDSSGLVKAKEDPFDRWKQYEWNPVMTGLVDVARKVLQNRPNCINAQRNTDGSHDQCPALMPGRRTLFAIMDTAQAKAYSLPEAQLLNPAGGFVPPDAPGFQAAVADMTVDPSTGVQSMPYGASDTAFSRDQKAYPLTTVQYAMLPTKDVQDTKAAAIAKFMRAVTTTGQVYGYEPGRLAPGFLALTAAQRTQAADAIGHLESQDGKLPGNQAAPPNPPAAGSGDGGGSTAAGGASGGTGTGPAAAQVSANGSSGGTGDGSSGSTGLGAGSGLTGSGAATGGAGAPAAPAPGAKPSATPSGPGKSLSAAPVAAGTPAADRSGTARLLLPIALIGGLVLLVGGPGALILGGTPAGEKALAGARKGWARVRRRP